MEKRILCYGDSNTFGFDGRSVPVDGTEGRYDEHTRWTGILGERLGGGYRVIDEGLCGRTTVFDDPTSYGRSGFDSLEISFRTHEPLDLVILMLGTNDVKEMFCASAMMIAKGMERLVIRLQEMIPESLNPQTKILIIAPPAVTKSAGGCFYYGFSEESVLRARALPKYYAAVAERRHCLFADAGAWISCDPSDGTHFGPEGHRIFAEKTEQLIRSALS